MTATRTWSAMASTLAVTLGLAAVCWAWLASQLGGMEMGGMGSPGPFPPFIGMWVAMMGAMMLPGLVPMLWRRIGDGGSAWEPIGFVLSYLAIWALVGVPIYLLYRPPAHLVAGLVTIAAAVYELTPLKRDFRRRCHEGCRSGFDFGLCCLGSSAGLMLMQVALGLMSLGWMAVATVLIVGQKLLPPRVGIDRAVALGLGVLGVLVAVAPAAVPGLMPAMPSMQSMPSM